MTFTQLEIFALVAELRSFTAAAARLGISQSAVSHALKSLETEFGLDLVIRERGTIEMTPVGQQLLLRTREILGLAEAMRQEVAAARGLHRGVLRIGSFGPTSSLKLLPVLLAAYRERHPGIDVQVEESSDSEVAQWLLDRRIDAGFVSLPDERFDTVLMAVDQLVALVPVNHPLASARTVTLEQLCGAPFIMTEAGSAGLIEPLFAAEGLALKPRYRMAQIITILGMVECGEGTSIVAELALPATLYRTHPGIVKLPLKPMVKRRIGLAVRSLRHAAPAARALLDLARELARASKFD